MNARIDTVLLVAAVIWCGAILGAAAFSLTPLYVFFSLICHQNPARSWRLWGNQLPVCIRCSSIYFGFLLALLLKRQPDAAWLKAAIVLTLLEFSFEVLVMNSVFARVSTGLLLGAAAAPFVRLGVRQMLGGERNAMS